MNKYSAFVLSALFAVALCAPFESIVDVTEDTLGNYKFAFDSGDYSRVEERNQYGGIKGEFTFVDPKGHKHVIEYTGGAEKGTGAQGADIPQPVEDLEENKQARREHLAIFSAIENSPAFQEHPDDDDESPINHEEYLAAVKAVLFPSEPLVFQSETPEITNEKHNLIAAHITAVGH